MFKKGILNEIPVKYQLQDVKEPNLLRHIFPYDEIPRIIFDQKMVPIEPAEEMFITDTTFRDGQQARPPYAVEQIVALFDLLHKLGGKNGVIRQSEFFLYSKKDKEAVEKCLARDYQFPQVTSWIRTDKKELRLVKEMGLKETGILMSVSDYHLFLKLNKTRKEAFDWYLDMASTTIDAGIIPRCHLEDITRADFYGFVLPLVQKLMELSDKRGVPIKIRACDTLGYGVTYPGAALPRSIPKLIWGLKNEGGLPSQRLEWHGHNDFHKVHINGATAWLYGCSGVNGTLLGFGERTGNPPIEGLIIEYISLIGNTNGIDTTTITEIADYFRHEIKAHIAPNYPFVGSEFNTTRAGIHADGGLKDEEIYNIFDTIKILNRPPEVAVTDKSGSAGIAHWINSHLGLIGDAMVDKRHPGVLNIHRWVQQQYDEGRTTAISSEEMERQGRKHLPDVFMPQPILDTLKQRASAIAIELIEIIIDMPDMKSMDSSRQEPILQKLVNEEPFIQFAYITNLEGRQITKNITRIVDRAKYATFDIDQDFSDREWFIEPLKDGKPHVTSFYISKITGQLCITVSAPIRDPSEEIIGILGLDIRFEELVKLLDEIENEHQ
ncbi:TPA: histone-lysine N-methyltransferase [Candidatus Poribacteria bacterium]|nr:histone-lysine N-methyltransferase [Candidatus Poribacteria bacterium]